MTSETDALVVRLRELQLELEALRAALEASDEESKRRWERVEQLQRTRREAAKRHLPMEWSRA